MAIWVLHGTAGPAPTLSADAAQTTAFLARTSGLDATHTNAYKALINGLVADGVFAQLDALYIFATQDATTAQLNLISTNFSATPNGAPNFSADNGYLGVDASATVYLDTGFTPSTAGGVYTLNSAHVSAWSLTNAASGGSGGQIVGAGTGGTTEIQIIPSYAGTDTFFRINDAAGTSGINADSRGHYLVNRTGVSTSQAYRNGTLFSSPNATSVALPTASIAVLGQNEGGHSFGGGYRIAMASIGSDLVTGGFHTSFYNRLRTYMTAVGVP